MIGALRLPSVLWLLFLLAACGDDAPREYRETVHVFGTKVDFTIFGIDKATARRAVSAVALDFQAMHRDWHAWRPGMLTDLNQALARGETLRIDPFLLPLVVRAKELQALSGGLFDPAIGGLVALWGFHDDEPPQGEAPPLEAIRELAARRPSMDDVIVEGDLVSSRNPAVSLDFGAFAKGVAVERGLARLKEFGVERAIINAGGGMAVMGRPEGRPWRMGIRHPRHWGVIAGVTLEDGESLHTSGNYERFREHEGIRHSHIIDPRDGMPVDHVASSSVIHRDAALADAAATALAVAGPAEWQKTVAAMGLELGLMIDENGVAHVTPAMLERLTFEPGEPTGGLVVAGSDGR